MNEPFQLTLPIIITAITTIITALGGALAIQRKFHTERFDRLVEQHQIEISILKNQYKSDISTQKSEISTLNTQLAQERYKNVKELHETKEKLESDYKEKTLSIVKDTNIPIKQELKMVYVKYLCIRKESEPPLYKKYIDWSDKTIGINSECYHFRLNKINHKNNSITITDRSIGDIDQKILFPWKKLAFTDTPSKKIKGIISQDISDSDMYFSVGSYYNGFKENDEDVGMKMEMDTDLARMVVDFSSIDNFQELFVKEPDAYKIELNGNRTELLGLERIAKGIYHLEATNLKKGESLLLDFHVNWDFLRNEKKPYRRKK